MEFDPVLKRNEAGTPAQEMAAWVLSALQSRDDDDEDDL